MPISIYKKRGETPLQALGRLRSARQDLAEETLSYAGRLDPMAEGELLVLVGDENQDREKYLGLNKSYEVEILFGVSTDTGDVLGLITDFKKEIKIDREVAEKVTKESVGTFIQPYPKYSSKSIAHNFEPVEPKEVTIYNTVVLGWHERSGVELEKEIASDIGLVGGGFRQADILTKWKETIPLSTIDYQLITISVQCSSGTYMRLLAERIGDKLGIPALAYRIKRTKIGLQNREGYGILPM